MVLEWTSPSLWRRTPPTGWPHIAPGKLAKSTLARDKQDIDRFLPVLGGYKLTDLKPEHFRYTHAFDEKKREVSAQMQGKLDI